ncbi:right-handed parallel beta-helix repeat-containing protein [Candidatus Sumerlaeota bacterium]|nr:right-handed parallel beta-helix repeat-containing protein [Candidatus Sumerlaeota bacterium]
MLKRRNVLLWGILLLTAICFAQGPLVPPGPPGETYKSLGEIEPRTPIKSLPYTISAPGSYYLTGNLTYSAPTQNGISIEASNVTIDFMGFAINGPGTLSTADFSGIATSGARNNITIKNGSVYEWKNDGINLDNTTNTLVMNMNIARIGDYGIYGESHTQIINCNVSECVDDGIYVGANALVKDCNAFDCDYGIYTSLSSKVINCAAYQNALSGIAVASGSTVQGCASYMNDGDGFLARGRAINIIGCTSYYNDDDGYGVTNAIGIDGDRYQIHILDSVAEHNSDNGIEAGKGSNIQRCNIMENDGAGIHLAQTFGTINQGTKPSYSTIKDCNIYDNGEQGVYIYSYAVVTGNVCSSNYDGIWVRLQIAGPILGDEKDSGSKVGVNASYPGKGNRIEGNSLINNTNYGLYAPDDSNSLIIKNWAYSNGSDYNIGSGNLAGPIVTGSLGTNDNPHANYSYLLP